MTEGPEAVIVGAGISGLTCLWRLRNAGIDAVCLESGDRAGGVIGSRFTDGFLVEAGPNTVAGSPELDRLVREAALESEVVRAPAGLPRFLYRDGRLHRVPTGPLELVSTGILSTRAKVGLLAEPLVPRRSAEGEESVREFVTRRLGAEIYDKVVAALLSGTFAGDGGRLAMRAVFPLLAEIEEEHGSVLLGLLVRAATGRTAPRGGGSFSFRDGFERLPKRLAEKLAPSIRRRSEARAIAARTAENGRFEIVIRDAEAERRITTRAVVLAVPSAAAGRLLERLAPQAAAALGEFESPPLACVSLAWQRSDLARPAEGFGFLVPRGEGVRILGCVYPSAIYPERAPRGWASFTSFLGGSLDPDGAALGEEPLVDAVRADLASILGAAGTPRVLAVDRHPAAIPQYTLGHLERVTRIRSAVARIAGLFLSGSFLTGISIGDSVREAGDAAEKVITWLGTSR
ncbi:MAG: protoporphyrinogen oxidase [Candidatus Binatia bacterium]